MAQERNYVRPIAPRRISKRARFYILKRDQFKCVKATMKFVKDVVLARVTPTVEAIEEAAK